MLKILNSNIDDFIKVGKHLTVNGIETFSDVLQISYTLDVHHKFLTKVMYPVGTLDQLLIQIGATACRQLYCHIALIEGLKYIATFIRTFDITTIADGLNTASLEFFLEVASRAWTQHFMENGITDYFGPQFINKNNSGTIASDIKTVLSINQNLLQPIPLHTSESAPILVSNGGGKDSFLACKILEEAGFPISIFQHARSEYGRFDQQHSIQSQHIKHLDSRNIRAHHCISIIDDWTDGSLMSLLNPQLVGEVSLGYPCQVGWPEMIFEALPFVLIHGYAGIALGNERSADSPQATWTKLQGDREINHQWLKSFQACQYLRTFLQTNLISNFEVFSILKPMHDYRIYQKLAQYPQILPHIHSCNIIKPWCKKCSKCCYVFVNLTSRFGQAATQSPLVFGSNLFDDIDNLQHWTDLLGLGEHNSWECVGENGETQLAFKRCYEKFLCKGRAIDLFTDNFVKIPAGRSTPKMELNQEELLQKYDQVYENDHGIPLYIFDKVKRLM